jgi:hypothetical protein
MTGFGAVLRPLRRLARALGTTRRTVAALPDVVEAILVLPTVSRQLEVVAFQTATLADLRDELVRVQRNTATLPGIDERLAHVHAALGQVEGNTRAVEQLAQIALPLSGAALRVGRFSDRLPQSRLPARRKGVG